MDNEIRYRYPTTSPLEEFSEGDVVGVLLQDDVQDDGLAFSHMLLEVKRVGLVTLFCSQLMGNGAEIRVEKNSVYAHWSADALGRLIFLRDEAPGIIVERWSSRVYKWFHTERYLGGPLSDAEIKKIRAIIAWFGELGDEVEAYEVRGAAMQYRNSEGD